MTTAELLKEKGLSLALFDKDLWDRPAFYIPELKTIFINQNLTQEERDEVIYHEIGHIEHNPSLYSILHEKYELQANRIMIRHLLHQALNSLDDYHDFNYLNFMKHQNLKTITDEVIIKEELKKWVG